MGRSVVGVTAGLRLALPAAALAQRDLSSGGRVKTDLWQSTESPAEALLDRDIATQRRVSIPGLCRRERSD
jgi:hypothetical protein